VKESLLKVNTDTSQIGACTRHNQAFLVTSEHTAKRS
jgi:hypothetical protein